MSAGAVISPLTDDALDPAGPPQGDRGVDVARGERLEVTRGDVCAGHPGAES